jgi:hypothetical protein
MPFILGWLYGEIITSTYLDSVLIGPIILKISLEVKWALVWDFGTAADCVSFVLLR